MKTEIMGILNVTPDSFSDGGSFTDPEKALAHALDMVTDGADYIDVGAESTRPGFSPLSVSEELERLLPIIPLLVEQIPLPISLDTYKARTAEWALGQGVKIINDIWGGLDDTDMFRVLAGTSASYILMHNSTKQPLQGQDIIREVREQMETQVEAALRAGMREEQIILDPGIGFGKTQPQNLLLINRLAELRIGTLPLLVGPSRKSLIGHVLSLPVDQRLEGTAALVCASIFRGAKILRVHDVKAMVRVARMTDAIVSAESIR